MLGDFRTPDEWDSSGELRMGSPGDSAWAKYGLGIVVPLVIAGFAVAAIVTRRYAFSEQSGLVLHDARAVALGIAGLAGALFLNCDFYWENVYSASAWGTLGKIGSLVTFIVSVFYLVIEVEIFGRT